jgi:CheY-like chemotaxis protein
MASPTPVRILVIDDDPGIVRALVRLLRRDGYTVDTAGNGRHALAQLQVQRYDVILTDLRMPELDGRAFYTHLLQQYPALRQRVIFLTGESGAADTRAFLAQCGQPWLAKPYAIAALRRTIQQVRRSAAPVQPLARLRQVRCPPRHERTGAGQPGCATRAPWRCQGPLRLRKVQVYDRQVPA